MGGKGVCFNLSSAKNRKIRSNTEYVQEIKHLKIEN